MKYLRSMVVVKVICVRCIRLLVYFCIVFFFFQAEDGIRDVAVTGVQTCALPIWRNFQDHPARPVSRLLGPGRPVGYPDEHWNQDVSRLRECAGRGLRQKAPAQEIGRASCRERVEIWGGEVVYKKKREIWKEQDDV